jgi:hypothetical protein
MKGRMWLALLAVLVLMASGCEPKPNDAPPPPTATQKEVPAEEAANPEVPAPTVATEESDPAESMAPGELVEPAPAETEMVAPGTEVEPPAAETARPRAPAVAVEPSTAAKPSAGGAPETVVYAPPFGRVTFNHQAHAGSFDCASCHSIDPPGKIVMGKDKAHDLCRGCHQQMAAGPAQCSGCHKKG